MGSAVTPDLSKGGTIDGDLTIGSNSDLVVTGDFKVEGAGSFAFDEIIEGTQVIEKTSTEAFLVRKDSDGGDVFVVDTQDSRVEINGFLKFSNASYIQDIGNNYLKLRIASGDYFAIHGGASDTQYFKIANDGSTLFSGDVSIDSSGGSLVVKNTGTGTDADADITLVAGAGGVNADFWKIRSDHSDNKLYFINGNDTRGTFTSSGTFTVTEKLKVDAVSGSHGILGLESGSGNEWLIVSSVASNNLDFYNGTPGTVMTITKDTARVGIGTISPGEKLAVADGNIEAIMTTAGSGLRMIVDRVDTSDFAGFETRTGGNQKWFIGLRETSDDNLHFYDPNGTAGDRLVLDSNSRISLSNNDSSGTTTNTVFGRLAGANGTMGSNNAFFGDTVANNTLTADADSNSGFGYRALHMLTSGNNNTAVGAYSADAITSGNENTALGSNALTSLTTATGNTAIGVYSSRQNQTGEGNTSVGHQSLMGASGNSHTHNTAIGNASMQNTTTGSNNTAVGFGSLTAVTTGTANVALGANSADSITTGANNVLLGFESAKSMTIGAHNVAVGREALATEDVGNTSIGIGSYALFSQNSDSDNEQTNNISIGYSSSYYNVTGKNNTALGSFAMQGASGDSNSDNTALGYYSLYSITTGGENVAIGSASGDAITTGSRNITIGRYAGSAITSGSHNIAIGYASLDAVTTTNSQIAIGDFALSALTSGLYNTAIGTNAGKLMTANSSNTIIGDNAFIAADGNEDKNVVIGAGAGDSINSDQADNNVIIGKEAWRGGTGLLSASVVIGSEAGKTPHVRNVYDSVFIGHRVAYSEFGGGCNYNVGIGTLAMSAGNLNDAHGNVAVGWKAMEALTQSDNNVAIGRESLKSILAGDGGNIALGYLSGRDVNSGTKNVYIGYQAGMQQTSGSGSINIGNLAGQIDSSSPNTIIGSGAFAASNNSSSGNNVIVGYEAGGSINHADSTDNIIIGRGAGGGGAGEFTNNIAIGSYALDGTGTNDVDGTVAIGHYAGSAITSGAGNLALGYEALKTSATESQSVAIGYQSMALTANSSENTMVGYKSGYDLSAGSDNNTGIGHDALGGTHGSGASEKNTAIGSGSMAGAVDGAARNTAIGVDSLKGLTSGDDNIAIGYNALPANTTASNNVAIGRNSMLNITTGQRNVAVGSYSMAMNHDGNPRESVDNVFIGYNSGGGSWANASSNYNTAIGANTMDAACNAATGNVALGYGALTSLTEGDGNVAVGMNTLEDLNTGTYNTAIGREAIKNVTTGTRNVGLGLESGITLTTGSYNTIIGSGANVGANNHAYTTSVGYQAESENDFETSLGFGGAFKFASFTYGADHASADDGDIASSHGTNIKIPAYAVIKGVSAIVTQLSNLGTYNLAVVMSDDAGSPGDDSAMLNPVELIGAGASTSKSGGSGNASDVECGSGAVLKKAFYNGFDGNGQHVGAGDKYIHLVNAGTSNGDTDPSTIAQVKILVEYVGMD